MGHKRLGYLPKTKAWRLIVEQLGGYSLGTVDAASIAMNTLKRIQYRYSGLKDDPSINSAFEYLVHVSLAFQKENPAKYLRENNILESDDLSLIKIARGALTYKSDKVESYEYQTFARQAAIDAINNWYGDNIERDRSLFHDGVNPEAVFYKANNGGGFSELSRLYFSKLTERYLKYFLDREASTRISNLNQRNKFAGEIEKRINDISVHAFETSKITQSFAAGWFNRNVKNDVPQTKEIKYFLRTAFGKMKSELLREEVN